MIEHAHILQLQFCAALHQAHPFGAISDQQEHDLAMVLEDHGRIENCFEVMGHAMRAEVRRNKLALQPQLFTERVLTFRNLVEGKINPILDDSDFPSIDPLLHHVALESVRHWHDRLRVPISKHFEILECADNRAIFDRTYRQDRVWPEIANLQHPGCALNRAYEKSSKAIEKLRRGGDHHVRFRYEWNNQDRAYHERDIVERAFDEPLVGCHIGPHPNHLNPGCDFALEEPV